MEDNEKVTRCYKALLLLSQGQPYGKTDHFAHNFKIELLVFKGSVDLKQ